MENSQRIAIVSVINDLVSDTRVKKIAETLSENNFSVVLIGRVLPESPSLPNWNFRSTRFKMLFRTGPLFYAFFQVRLFSKLLFSKADLLYANDLDTLLPNQLVSRIKGVPLIYDSHEIFCEVPELQKTNIKKKIWEKLEQYLLPRVQHRITVNSSIAEYFLKKYGTRFEVVRNIPPAAKMTRKLSRAELNLPVNKRIILLQGAGINIDRGAEELVESMKQVENALLMIIGSGDVWNRLERLSTGLSPNKVRLISRVPKDELTQYTLNADLGISIDKNTNLNYFYSLPNKLFDYIQCGLPVLVSRLPEIEAIVKKYDLGEFIPDHQPESIAASINSILSGNKLAVYRQNSIRAARELSWEKEKTILTDIIHRASDKKTSSD